MERIKHTETENLGDLGCLSDRHALNIRVGGLVMTQHELDSDVYLHTYCRLSRRWNVMLFVYLTKWRMLFYR